MLQLFKQSDSPAIRQQLQDICSEFEQAGESFDLPVCWHELSRCAKRAIANPDNNFRTLAPALIKDLKQAQDLVLAGRASEVAPSLALQELQPLADVLEDEADVLTLNDSPGEWVNDVADVSDRGLADMGAASDGDDHLFDEVNESLNDIDLENINDLGADENATEGLLDREIFDDNALGELSEGSDSSYPNADDSLGLSLDIDNSEDLDLDFEDLNIESSNNISPRQGPQVGAAELNSLADLFESEGSKNTMDWKEEVIDDASDLLVDGLALEASDDFSDLLFDEEESRPSIEHQDVDDISALLNGAEKSAAQAPPDIAQDDEFADLFEVGTPNQEKTSTTSASDGLEELGDFFNNMSNGDEPQPELTESMDIEGDEKVESSDRSTIGLTCDTADESGPEDIGSTDDFDSLFDVNLSGEEGPTDLSDSANEWDFENELSGESTSTEQREADLGNTASEFDDSADFDSLFDRPADANELSFGDTFNSALAGEEDGPSDPVHSLTPEDLGMSDDVGASLEDVWDSGAPEVSSIAATNDRSAFESLDVAHADNADGVDSENLNDVLDIFSEDSTTTEDDINALFFEDEDDSAGDNISSDVTEELPEGLLNEISEELVEGTTPQAIADESAAIASDSSFSDPPLAEESDFDFGFDTDLTPTEISNASVEDDPEPLSLDMDNASDVVDVLDGDNASGYDNALDIGDALDIGNAPNRDNALDTDDTVSDGDANLSDFEMSDGSGESSFGASSSRGISSELDDLDLEAEFGEQFNSDPADADMSLEAELLLEGSDFSFDMDASPDSSGTSESLDFSDIDADLDGTSEEELTGDDISFESLDTDSELRSNPTPEALAREPQDAELDDRDVSDFLGLEAEHLDLVEPGASADDGASLFDDEEDSEATLDVSPMNELEEVCDSWGGAGSGADELDDLDALLEGDMSETSDPYNDEDVEASRSDLESFDDLEAFLSNADEAESSDSEDEVEDNGASITSVGDEFDDLDALLDTPATGAIAPVAGNQNFSSPDAEESGEDDFSDLEKLLEDADHKLGGSPTAKAARGPSPVPSRRPAARRGGGGLTDQTMRVSIKNLDNLNNLVGELVVNRNSLEQSQERLRQFLDNLLYQVQQLSDVGQRMRDLYERSLLESSLLTSRRGSPMAVAPAGGSTASAVSDATHATGESFDALEMDRFTGFHTLSQEMIELIVRVREAASDIDFVIDESDQTTRMFRQVTTQLQEGLTRSRMVPFSQAASRLPRAVRDISIKCGKQAELIVEGKDTLIDKMILEQLYDPMTHLVNNAITHGIETPDERIALHKPPVGKITIRIFHQGNQTIIAVTDDGAGIDPENVKGKALQRGLISPEEAQSMSRLDIYDLIFHHGFSTRDQADDFAGRGVGMDVVRTSLSEIRGVVSIDSAVGQGTTFTIRLPLTLSISKALLCVSNRARIAFPMDGVEDMLDVPSDRIQTDADGQSCILWRDIMLPFRPLTELLKYNRVMGRGSVYGGNQEEDVVSVVVLRSAGNYLALQVDQVLGEQEIVIKQLEAPVPKPAGIAGATVLGDGRIMPIADVLELIDLSMGRIRREAGNSLWEQEAARLATPPASDEKSEPTVLIVDDSITVRELLSMTFNKVGYRVEQARDGQEAWEKLKSGLPCELVFCDIEMPRMDGLELLSRLQKDANLKDLPIAMLTSRGADRHRQMAIQLGAKGYFTKPYLEEALLDAAQRMLSGEVLVSQ